MRFSRFRTCSQLQEVHFAAGRHHKVGIELGLGVRKPDQCGCVEIGRLMFAHLRTPRQVVGIALHVVTVVIDKQRAIEAALDEVGAASAVARLVEALCDGHVALLQVGACSQVGHIVVDEGLGVADGVSLRFPNPIAIDSALLGRHRGGIDASLLRVESRSTRLAFGQHVGSQKGTGQQSQESGQYACMFH